MRREKKRLIAALAVTALGWITASLLAFVVS